MQKVIDGAASAAELTKTLASKPCTKMHVCAMLTHFRIKYKQSLKKGDLVALLKPKAWAYRGWPLEAQEAAAQETIEEAEAVCGVQAMEEDPEGGVEDEEMEGARRWPSSICAASTHEAL